MAYSSGFNPHPRISYANASPTGAATEAEYLEIGLASQCDPEVVRRALDDALPPGLDILAVVPAGARSLTDLLQASRWRIDLVDADAELVRHAVREFVASSSVMVTRMTKSGLRTFDARAAVLELTVVGDRELELVSVQGVPLVRPDDVVTALRAVVPDLQSDQPPLVARLEQGSLVDGGIADPFA